MNEKKIQALAEQVNLGPCCESQAVAIKKFAELIVRECAELATKEYNNYGGIHGNDLLEHFGVEE